MKKSAKQGRIVKIKHNGLKHYAVIKGQEDDKKYVLSFPMFMSGSVAIVDLTVASADIKAVSFTQDSPTACLLRQLTGIEEAQHHLPLKKQATPQPATGKLGHPEPAQPKMTFEKGDAGVYDAAKTNAAPQPLTEEQIGEFKIGGVKIKDMPEGVEKEMAKSIAKGMMGNVGGIQGIEFA